MKMFNPLDLSDRKILVTGASSGIGRATAIYLSRLGAKIVLNGRDVERLQQTERSLQGNGHMVVPFDLETKSGLTPLFDEATHDGERLNGLVHCAGIPFVVPLSVLTTKQLEKVMSVNFYPFVELIRQYAKTKYSERGCIVGISSTTSICPSFAEIGYGASKAALNYAVTSTAIGLAEKGIRINGVISGLIRTELLSKIAQETESVDCYIDEHNKKYLLGVGKPDDVAGPVAFLMSEMSRHITGRMIYVDGGLF